MDNKQNSQSKTIKPADVMGMLRKYADPTKISQEKKAWEKSAVKKHKILDANVSHP
ncbi:MAG: hypothetical protein LBL80_00040 [Ruminococcus sp.]|nr:hypothetical protein [Ruminococcus sp.]